jgi:hypothetical protein
MLQNQQLHRPASHATLILLLEPIRQAGRRSHYLSNRDRRQRLCRSPEVHT